ncbi:MAG: DNA damage-inducible protein D [Oligoflexia bacterium]|nr:DNA damage-inducible protein D [Oligoflexia bacterium]
MEKELIARLHKNFEDFVRYEDGVEFWYARDLQNLLGYARWENFTTAIEKAKQACYSAKNETSDHFLNATKMVDIGSGTQREIADVKLTRYACYLVAQNGDPRKAEIAFAQTYFAMQTRKQELIEQRFAEFERISAREKLTQSEKLLAGIVFERGVDQEGFARIKSKGDQVLFGGYSTREMKQKLSIPEKRALADFLPEVTISAKQLSNAITSHNIKEKNLKGENPISIEHQMSNKEVRGALTRAGIYPERLPPAEDIKKVESRLKSETKKLPKQVKKLKGSQNELKQGNAKKKN